MTLGELQTTDGNHIMKTTLRRSKENDVPQDVSNRITKEKVTPLFNVIKSSKLVKLLRKSITTMPKKPVKSKFIFENTIKAAESNMTLIKKYDFNIDNVFKSEPNSTIQLKFEFRDQNIVSDLFDLSTDGEKLKIYVFKVLLILSKMMWIHLMKLGLQTLNTGSRKATITQQKEKKL